MELLVVFSRVIILYIVVLLVLRVMGKKQVSTLQPYELVTIILIADVAAIPMATTGTPLVHGLIGVFALLTAQFTVSFLTLKSRRVRSFVSGRPTIIVSNGSIVEEALEELRYGINDLLEQMRVLGYPNINDVEFAILETNGQLSVIPKSQKRPVNPEDLGVSTQYEGAPMPIIVDGKLDVQNLERLNLDMTWLLTRLKEHGTNSPKEILFAVMDTQGNFYCQRKNIHQGAAL